MKPVYKGSCVYAEIHYRICGFLLIELNFQSHESEFSFYDKYDFFIQLVIKGKLHQNIFLKT